MNVTHSNPHGADGGQVQDPARETTLYQSSPEDIRVLFEAAKVCAIFQDDSWGKPPRLLARFIAPKPLARVCFGLDAQKPADSGRIFLLLEDGSVIFIRDKRYGFFYRDFEHNDLAERSGIDFVRDVRSAREAAGEALKQKAQDAAARNGGMQTSPPAGAVREGMWPYLRERLMVPLKGMFWFNGSALLAMPADFAMREPAESMAWKLERYGISQVLELTPPEPRQAEQSWLALLNRHLGALMQKHEVSLRRTVISIPPSALAGEEALDAFLESAFAGKEASGRALVVLPSEVLEIMDNYSRTLGRGWINSIGYNRNATPYYLRMGTRRIEAGDDDWLIRNEHDKANVRASLFFDYRASLGSVLSRQRVIFGLLSHGAVGFSISNRAVFDPPVPLFMGCAWMEPFRTISLRSHGYLVLEDGTVIFQDGSFFKNDAKWKGIEFLEDVRSMRQRGGSCQNQDVQSFDHRVQ